MNTRPARPGDFSTLASLRIELLRQSGRLDGVDTAALQTAITRFFAAYNGRTCHTLVAEEGRQVVGMGSVSLFDRPPTPGNLAGRQAWLSNLCVIASHRGQGIGSRLLAELIQRARDLGAGRVSLHASVQMRPLYQRHGFQLREDELQLDLTARSARSQ